MPTTDGIEELEDLIIKACHEAGYHFGAGEGSGVAARAAMDWFTRKQKSITDKAVCPSCGRSFYPSDETARFFICSCGQSFDIEVIVITKLPRRDLPQKEE